LPEREARQLELEQEVNTLHPVSTKNCPAQQHPLNQTQRVGGGERHIWTLVRQYRQEKEKEQVKNRALEERIRVLEERVREMACDREHPHREGSRTAPPQLPTKVLTPQQNSPPQTIVSTSQQDNKKKTNEEPQAQGIPPTLSPPPPCQPP
jgi:hypothetical protein